jgi:DNA-binding CsgD family transcriptional regulator
MREEGSGEYDDAIERVYEAAVGDDAWPVCLSVLCEATGAIGVVFSDLGDPVNAAVSDSLRDVNRLYRERWWREDVFLGTALNGPPKPGLLYDDAFDGRIDRENHPFFRDFLRGNGFDRFAAYFSPPLFGARFILMAQRALGTGPFSSAEMKALDRLAPHVTRALAITGRVRIARSRDEALLAILDKMGYGALIVGASGRVHASNQTAQNLLGDGLALQDGRLVEGASTPRGLVEGLIKSAAAVDTGKSRSALLHRPSGRKPLVLQAMTFSGDLPWTAAQRTETTLLMLIDTDGPAVASQMSVVQSFGLTSAEARVASIVGAGFSPVEAAEQLGSAAGTVRTQLKNVFNKLDLKRQSELVRLMTKLEILGG